MKYSSFLVLLISLLMYGCDTQSSVEELSKEDFQSERTFHNDLLVKVENTNINGKVIFVKENLNVGNFLNDKYATWIRANKFDKNENLEFRVWGHSNIGLKIHFPEKINDSTEIEMTIEDGFDFDPNLVNTNQFRYIDEINNTSELFNHTQVRKMLQYGNKFHGKTILYDSKGNVTKEIWLEESRDTSFVVSYEFDETGNNIFSNHNNQYEFHNDFDASGNETSRQKANYS